MNLPSIYEQCWAGQGKVEGRRRIICVIFSLALMIVYFHRMCPAVIVNELFSVFHIESASAVGSLSAIYFYIYFLMQIPAGILTDMFGTRKIAFWGITLAAIGSICFGAAMSTSWLIVGRLLVGLGVSVIYISSIRLYSAWFSRNEFGTAVGITLFAGNLGGIMASTPLAGMINLFGYSASFILFGLFSLGVAAFLWCMVRDEPREFICPVQARSGVVWREISVCGKLPLKIYRVVRDPHLWLAVVAAFCIYGPYMALAGVWGVPYLMQIYGLGRNEAATFNIMFSVGLMLGALISGFVSDRLGSRKKPYIALASGNLLVWALLFWWGQGMPPLEAVISIFFLLGFFANAGFLSSVMVKEYNSDEVAGLASSIGNLGGIIGSAFMQPFFGYILDLHWAGAVLEGVKLYPLGAFREAFGACFAMGCPALLSTLLLRESL